MPYESRCRPTSPPTTAAPQFSVPVDVASHTGAMQAQEHRIQHFMCLIQSVIKQSRHKYTEKSKLSFFDNYEQHK